MGLGHEFEPTHLASQLSTACLSKKACNCLLATVCVSANFPKARLFIAKWRDDGQIRKKWGIPRGVIVYKIGGLVCTTAMSLNKSVISATSVCYLHCSLLCCCKWGKMFPQKYVLVGILYSAKSVMFNGDTHNVRTNLLLQNENVFPTFTDKDTTINISYALWKTCL